MIETERKSVFYSEIEYWKFYIDWIRTCSSLNPKSPNKNESIWEGIKALYDREG